METHLEPAEKRPEKPEKGRSQEEKISRRKWIIRTLKRMEERQKRMDRRIRMLARGLRDLFIFDEDYISRVICKDDIDRAILNALRIADHAGRRTGELAANLGIDHRDVSRRITRMNKRIDKEMEELVIMKQEGKWRLTKRFRLDFAAAREKIDIEEQQRESETDF